MIDLVGQTLLRYRLDVAMRAGYSGQVYRAKDTQSGADVAVKVFKPSAAPQAMKAALQPLLQLKHPNIVQSLELGESPNGLFLVTEFVQGGSLSTLLSRYSQENKQLEYPLALSLMRQAAEALTHAHGMGIIHGDIKPDNLLLSVPTTTTQLSRAYALKIGDFSVSKIASDSAITQEELIISSPAYMSPEQCQGLPSDSRTDLYSFGILMYEVFTGLLPFEVKNIGEAAIKHLYAAPRSPKELRADLSNDLETLILRLLSKNPADRYANTGDVRDALQGMLERIEPQGPPPTIIRNASDALPTMPAIADLPDKSDSPRVSVIDSFGRIVKVLTLTNAGIRAGRLETNEAKLDDDQVSRQHLRVDWNGEQAYITDLGSSNGTHLAGQRMLPHSPTPWSFRGHVSVGSYWLRLEAPEVASRLLVGVALDAASERLVLQAGSAGVVRVTVANLGRLVDHFNFRIDGIPAEWVRGPTDAVQLNPGVQTAVMLTVMPPRNASATAGKREITVVATSREHTDNTASAKGTLTIEPFAQTTLNLKPLRKSARTKTTFTASLTNNGNAKLNYALYCEEDEPQLGFKFAAPLLSLEPGESRDVPLEVTASFKLLGGTQIRPFRVIARGSTRAIRFPSATGATSSSGAGLNPAQLAQKAQADAQARAAAIQQSAGDDALQQAQNAMLGDGKLDLGRVASAAQGRLTSDATAIARQGMQAAQGGLLAAGQKALSGAGKRNAQLAPLLEDGGALPGSDPMIVTAQLAHGALLPMWLPPAILALLALLFFVFNRPPTITTFEASTLQPFLKTPVPVRFETGNAGSLELQIGANNPVKIPNNASTYTVPGFTALTPVKLTLIARGNFGASAQKEITVTPQARQPSIAEFRAIPPQLIRGQPVLLRYNVKDAEALLFDRGDGQPPVPLRKMQGTIRDTPREPRTYKLIAINGDKRVELPLSLAVDVLPPQIIGFKIGPTTVIRGQTLTIQLEWKTRNVSSVEVTDFGTGGQSDTQILAAPTASKTYTLTATNSKGQTVTRSIPVNVVEPAPVVAPPPPPPPPPVAVVVPPPVAPPPPVVAPPPPPVVPPPPTPRVVTPSPPPVVVPPPTVKPPVVVVKPPVLVRPPVAVAKPPVAVVKPPVTVAKPPVAVAKPPVVAVVKPPTASPPPPAPPPPPPTTIGGPMMGAWYHNYGTLNITQIGNRISGSYQNLLTGSSSRFTGRIEGSKVRGLSEGKVFTWTINGDGTTFEGTNTDGTQWCGAKQGTVFNAGCSFSGTWISASKGLTEDKRENCEIKLTRTDDDIKGTYCNGELEGKIEFRNGQAVFTGQFKNQANSRGNFAFVLSGSESKQFGGNASSLNGQQVEAWCGWRGGRGKPEPCMAK